MLNQTDRYTQFEAILSLAGMDMPVSELHGTVVGAVANHLKSGVSPDLMLLVIGSDQDKQASVPQLKEALFNLYRETSEFMFSGEQGFEMLLPDDDEPLENRVEAMTSWCQGYLLGLLCNEIFSIDELPEKGGEIVRDIMQISEAGAGLDEEREEDWALAELEEYVKVGVQLVFESIYNERAQQALDVIH